MSILVTGSAGHLGEALVRSLRAEGRSAIGIDLKPSPFTDQVGSICDRSFVESCMKRASAVVHAATLHKPHVATHSWQDFIDTNPLWSCAHQGSFPRTTIAPMCAANTKLQTPKRTNCCIGGWISKTPSRLSCGRLNVLRTSASHGILSLRRLRSRRMTSHCWPMTLQA